jgi:D-arabinose 5-phosphate isomerase GutQ
MHQATGTALSRCLQQEASAIAAASERLDPGQVEAALALLTSCAARRGKLVVSGVGKSGIVARKIAATFSSLSLTAVFLHPGDALHGDMGIVAADDVVLLLSNSGETEELLAILPHLRRRGTARIALVAGRPHDVVVDASEERETSSSTQLPPQALPWSWRLTMTWQPYRWSGPRYRRRTSRSTIRPAHWDSSSRSASKLMESEQ